MTARTFIDYALSEDLSPDATYTVELLIDRVDFSFGPKDWDKGMEREQPD